MMLSRATSRTKKSPGAGIWSARPAQIQRIAIETFELVAKEIRVGVVAGGKRSRNGLRVRSRHSALSGDGRQRGRGLCPRGFKHMDSIAAKGHTPPAPVAGSNLRVADHPPRMRRGMASVSSTSPLTGACKILVGRSKISAALIICNQPRVLACAN